MPRSELPGPPLFSRHFVDRHSWIHSSALSSLFSGGAGLWTFAGSVAQPIFTAGKLRSGVRLAEAQQQEALLGYQQIIQGAFRDVSDALIAYQKNQEFRVQQELLVKSAQDAAQLSGSRYQAGTTICFRVLTSETAIFPPTSAWRRPPASTNLLALVQIPYKALGGGWRTISYRPCASLPRLSSPHKSSLPAE